MSECSNQATMAQAAEAWNVQDASMGRIVVVGVQPALEQRLIAARAPIVIVTVTVHGHHLARELIRRIEAGTGPRSG
jgi:hypothetical protein